MPLRNDIPVACTTPHAEGSGHASVCAGFFPPNRSLRRRRLTLGLSPKLLFLVGLFAFSAQEVAVKQSASELQIIEVLVFRFGFTSVLLFPLLWRRKSRPSLRAVPIHALRAVLGIVTLASLYAGLRELPLVTVTGLFFLNPIMSVAGATHLLGERGQPRSFASLALGGAGAWLLLGGLSVEWEAAAAYPLLAAASYTASVLLAKHLLTFQRERQVVLAEVTGIFVLLILFCVLGGVSPQLHASQLPSLLVIVAGGLIGSASFMFAFRRGAVTELAPLEYVALVFAVLWTFALGGQSPSPHQYVGMLVISVAGMVALGALQCAPLRIGKRNECRHEH